MNRQTLILSLDHDLLFKEFILFATKELGTIKMNMIIKNVNSSVRVGKFLQEARRINLRLGTDDFLGCINSSSSFFFSKGETISIATISLLKKWDYEIGSPNGLSDDIYLNKVLFSILDKCDGLKTHMKSAPNFFERFNNHLIRIITLDIVKNNIPDIKTEITFDSILCGAIKNKDKTEFRVIDNLEGINFTPDEWKLNSYDKENGALFSNNFLGESILVQFPYKLGSNIKVINSSFPYLIEFQIKITSFYLQRLKEVNQTDACREGFGAYKDKVEELYLQYPSSDAEYCLFLENWIEEHRMTLAMNGWLWVFEFKIDEERIFQKGRSDSLSQKGAEAIRNAYV